MLYLIWTKSEVDRTCDRSKFCIDNFPVYGLYYSLYFILVIPEIQTQTLALTTQIHDNFIVSSLFLFEMPTQIQDQLS